MKVEEEIENLKIRNKKVDADKAWEISKTRKVLVALLTYVIIVCFMWVLEMESPFVSAIIPTLGFLLSTISADFVKKMWLKYFYK